MIIKRPDGHIQYAKIKGMRDSVKTCKSETIDEELDFLIGNLAMNNNMVDSNLMAEYNYNRRAFLIMVVTHYLLFIYITVSTWINR